MTIPVEIERDWVRIAGQTVYRPENIVPGDWLSFWDAAVSPVDYQEAFDEGVESVKNDYDGGFSDGYEKAREDAIREIGRMG